MDKKQRSAESYCPRAHHHVNGVRCKWCGLIPKEAIKKVTKEETIQELSHEAYQRYIKKALKTRQAARSLDKDYPVFKKYGIMSNKKTEKGMQHAWGKLMKNVAEEVDIQELSGEILDRYVKKASQSVKSKAGIGFSIKRINHILDADKKAKAKKGIHKLKLMDIFQHNEEVDIQELSTTRLKRYLEIARKHSYKKPAESFSQYKQRLSRRMKGVISAQDKVYTNASKPL